MINFIHSDCLEVDQIDDVGLIITDPPYFVIPKGKIVKIDSFYPSSKTCSNCGCVKKELKLSERTYHCEECGFTIDRDLNASINILKAGLNMIEATVATTGTSLKNQSLWSSKKTQIKSEKNCETRKTIKKRKESL